MRVGIHAPTLQCAALAGTSQKLVMVKWLQLVIFALRHEL